MINEDYCSFEVSKLLKEKGFNEALTIYYRLKDEIMVTSGYIKDNEGLKKTKDFHEKYIPCPTHQMAMKYLREEKHIEIHVAMSALNADGSREYMYEIFFTNERYLEKSITKAGFKTHEEAVEAALKYCLTEIL